MASGSTIISSIDPFATVPGSFKHFHLPTRIPVASASDLGCLVRQLSSASTSIFRIHDCQEAQVPDLLRYLLPENFENRARMILIAEREDSSPAKTSDNHADLIQLRTWPQNVPAPRCRKLRSAVVFRESSGECVALLNDSMVGDLQIRWSWGDPLHFVELLYREIDEIWRSGLYHEQTPFRLWPEEEPTTPAGGNLVDPIVQLGTRVAEDSAPYGLPVVPKIPGWVNLREYQDSAIKAWRDAGGQGILAMATGTGKTLTALVLAMRVHARNQPMLLVVVCPFINLAEQWVRELRQFGVSSTRCYHSSEKWRTEAQDAVQRLQSKLDTIHALVVTNRTFLKPTFQALLKPEAIHHFLIADEAHNLGAEQAANTLPEGIKLRLGLSATPKRHMDEDGTQRLLDFFGGVVFEFGIKEALETPASLGSEKKVLCPYEYHPVLVSLDDDEAEEYQEISERLARCMGKDEDGNLSNTAKLLLIKRARLLAGARQKLPALDAILRGLSQPPRKAIFYCGDGTTEDTTSEEELRQIDAVTRLIGMQHNLRVRTFTYREKSSEREEILSGLRNNSLDGVVAIRCLDEGIDLPDMRMGFLLASSTNPRQFIQRRGRLLRNAPGKNLAIIYDFIVIPPNMDGMIDSSAFNMERNLFKRELVRICEFCETAENGPEALAGLLDLRRQYNLLSL
jgi:DNA phosphorothioation system restriction enzyme